MRRSLSWTACGVSESARGAAAIPVPDSPTGYVSLINRASVAAVEDYLGAPVDPLRFRGNLLVEGLDRSPSWTWSGG